MRGEPSKASNTIRLVSIAFLSALFACSAYNVEPADTRIKLPKGVDPNASVFRAMVQSSFPLGLTHDRLRPATCSSGGGNKCIVSVHIDVLGDTRVVDPASAPPTGLAIAHLVNQDASDKEAYFDLKPQSTAEYYVWVDNDGSGKPRYTLLELQFGNKSVTATKQWKVHLCHPHSATYPSGPSDFDFYEFKHGAAPCDLPDATISNGAHYASLGTGFPIRALLAFISRELVGNTVALRGSWIECGSGCCT
jgi:hypothetical protein